jgi:hypothetical protein
MKNVPAQPRQSFNLLEHDFVKRAKTFLLVQVTKDIYEKTKEVTISSLSFL